MALWAGPMNGQDIFTTLVGGATHDFIGAVRAFGMGHKCIFEQMTSLDEVEMNISWQLITHPQNANLWPYSFLNNTTHVKVQKVHIPADHSYIIFGCDMLTETHAVEVMREALESMLHEALHNLKRFMDEGKHLTVDQMPQMATPPELGLAQMPQPLLQAARIPQGPSTSVLTSAAFNYVPGGNEGQAGPGYSTMAFSAVQNPQLTLSGGSVSSPYNSGGQ